MYYYIGDIKTYYRNFGTINYYTGTVTMNELEITGIDQTQSDIFELIIKPQSNDVVSIRNQLVTIPDNNINVSVILDKVSVGDPAGGANFQFTSSRN
jgi:predicted transcriptional regulator